MLGPGSVEKGRWEGVQTNRSPIEGGGGSRNLPTTPHMISMGVYEVGCFIEATFVLLKRHSSAVGLPGRTC